MNKTTTDRRFVPEDEAVDLEVLAFREQFGNQSPLDELAWEGARCMLQSMHSLVAIET
jgi:hypothetical protein